MNNNKNLKIYHLKLGPFENKIISTVNCSSLFLWFRCLYFVFENKILILTLTFSYLMLHLALVCNILRVHLSFEIAHITDENSARQTAISPRGMTRTGMGCSGTWEGKWLPRTQPASWSVYSTLHPQGSHTLTLLFFYFCFLFLALFLCVSLLSLSLASFVFLCHCLNCLFSLFLWHQSPWNLASQTNTLG